MKMGRMPCWALAGVLLLAVGCGDDDGGSNTNDNNDNTNQNSNGNNNNLPDDTIYQVQDPSEASFIPEGGSVVLRGVVVTAVDLYGEYDGDVFVQEPDGGPYSGVLIYGPTVTGGALSDLSVGHVVNVTGQKAEFALTSDTSGRTTTEIMNGTIEIVELGTPLEPALISSPQLLMEDPGGEQYEGVLVSVQNVRRVRVDNYDNVHCTGGLTVGPDLMDVAGATVADGCYARITGVLDYFFFYALLPRTAADIEQASSSSVCDQSAEVCDDEQDNDGDGYIDCADEDCLGTGHCRENDPTRCSDGVDNDLDGRIDCADESCLNHPDVIAAGTCGQETGDASCSDGIDNDSDGHTDCYDFGCELNSAVTVCATELENTAAACSDGVDNNQNGHTDCDDFSCEYGGFCPSEETTDASCSDGVDNDSDGHADCEDWSCQRSILTRVCEGNVYTCSDGLDNDGNGFVDCDDLACRSCTYGIVSPVCPPCP